jgi:hypothetical protein
MGLLTRRVAASLPQNLTRLVLGAFMTGAGALHLTLAREEFRAQVPSWVPLDEDLVVLGSGLVVVGVGRARLTFPRHPRLTGVALAPVSVVVLRGNVAQYVEGVSAFGLDTDTKRLVRLFFQPVLVAAALYAAGWPERRRSASE